MQLQAHLLSSAVASFAQEQSRGEISVVNTGVEEEWGGTGGKRAPTEGRSARVNKLESLRHNII